MKSLYLTTTAFNQWPERPRPNTVVAAIKSPISDEGRGGLTLERIIEAKRLLMEAGW